MTAFLKLLVRNRLAAFGGVVLAIIVFLVLVTPLLGLQDPAVTDTTNRFLRPLSDGHVLGTDHLGRDMLSRLLWGTQLSLAVGFAAALIAALIGSAIGIIAGYFGGRVDNIFMRCIDVLMAFPYILLALAIVAALGPGLLNALIAVAAVNIPFFARNIRGVTVSLAQREFVEAAKLCGMSDFRIIWSEIVPNVIPVIVIAMSTTIGWMILETAGLSFLGLGSQPPQADLGSMLGEARNSLITDPHASMVPGVMIFLIVMSINLLGDGVRDALDPRLKSGALTRPQPSTKVSDTFNAVEADENNNAVLKVEQLETQFHINRRTYKAVNQVSFEIAPGECLGLIGESGSGKSVTALSVMGLVASPPGVICGGDIRFNDESLIGADYETLRNLRGKDVAYIFQDPLATLHPLYRVGEQMLEAILVHEKVPMNEAKERAISLLDAVHTPNAEERMKAFPHELSGGMRQRVAIAMALVNNPSLIIADEPTTALDVTVQGQILALLDELRRTRNVSVLFITHDFGVVAQLCDRVAVMYAGKIVETGPTELVLDAPAHPYTKKLIACVPELGRGKGKLEAIPGLPPVVDKLPQGCAFAARCSKAGESCQQGEVARTEVSNRMVLCHFPEEKLV
ncbi:dipeptide/oligopeptide/nickel ABC transporter permease/ATP-binding protein [Enterovibrio sp. ZSDZ35]|uniref:ABC-type dipeptide transporter n=1 Tax=Enterovibrio qingdaonensis TaxID=2899818 RepID=A0ABT5QKN8_9GAMM|nr:dipeptide/oligopeptide/nickel ABC transporter permease/ATP-binding protein [Enterovibrio sp. ZSDZ35]MDD1781050.1 dipeptide/oligopeptide/nickel ABC transporter permease/ATP-binding protein [Enterovibrio sp. ZSDZ35]